MQMTLYITGNKDFFNRDIVIDKNKNIYFLIDGIPYRRNKQTDPLVPFPLFG